MKKRLLSILLCICMVVTLLPTAALAADSVTVYVNDIELESGHSYAADATNVISETTTATTDYFTYTEVDATHATIIVTGNLALTSNNIAPLIAAYYGNLTINAPDGSITLTNTGGIALQTASGSVAFSAKGDITVGSGSFYAINASADLTSETGKIAVQNTGTGMAVSGALTAHAAGNITVSAATGGAPTIGDAPAVNGTPAIVSKNGSISLTNAGSGAATGGALTAQAQVDLSVISSSNAPTIGSYAALTSKTGKITVQNTGAGMAVSGALTAHAAGDIAVSAASGGAPTIGGATAVDGNPALVSDTGSITVQNTGTGMAVSGALTARAKSSITVSAPKAQSPVIVGAAVLQAPLVTVIRASECEFALVSDGITAQPSSQVLLIGGGSPTTVTGTDPANVLTADVYGGDVSDTGLNLSAEAPTVKTTYKAGSGTILWEPVLDTDNGTTVTSGTLTLTNATINAPDEALVLPDVSITLEVVGANTLTGSEGLTLPDESQYDLTIHGAAGSKLMVNATSGSGIVDCKGVILTGGVAVDISTTISDTVGIRAVQSVAIRDNAKLNVKAPFAGVLVGENGESIGSFTGTDRFTGTAAVLSNDDSGAYYDITIYGAHDVPNVLTPKSNVYGVSSLTVPTGATLTVPASETMDLSWATELATQVKISGRLINNGTIKMPNVTTAAQIKGLNLTGSGVVLAGETAYTNNGERLHVYTTAMDFSESADAGNWKEDATLENDGYKWDDKTKTLTLRNFYWPQSMTRAGLDFAIRLPQDEDVTLRVEGECVIRQNNIQQGVQEGVIVSEGSLRLVGSGTLTADQIEARVPLTVESGTFLLGTMAGVEVEILGGTLRVSPDEVNTDDGISLTCLNSYTQTGGTVTVRTDTSVEDYHVAAAIHIWALTEVPSFTVTGGTLSLGGADSDVPLMMQYAAEGEPTVTTTGMVVTTNPAGGTLRTKAVEAGSSTMMVAGYTADDELQVDMDNMKITNSCISVSFAPPPTGGPNTTTTTVTNPDGSITTTVTNKTTGTVTATTKYLDGSTVVIETKKDGSTTVNATVPSTVKGGANVNIPADLGNADGTVSVAVTYLDGTKETVKAVYVDGRVLLKLIGSAKLAVLGDFTVLAFNDVSSNDYFYRAVLWAVSKGITSGTTATTFSPNTTCTRAQTVTFLWRAMGSPEPTTTANPFTDVSVDAYYYKAVLWAVEKGITSGTSATTFSPDAVCSRAQVATFLWRAEGSPLVNFTMNFTDIPADSYYAEAVRWAVGEGITSGTGAATFSPAADCTRAQIVTFLFRQFWK